MAKFVGMWEGYKGGCKQESESILIDQLISLAREFKLDFHQYVPIIQQPMKHIHYHVIGLWAVDLWHYLTVLLNFPILHLKSKYINQVVKT